MYPYVLRWGMKRYAFLRLEYGANKVIADCGPCDFATALEKFRKMCINLTLDDSGYAKLGDTSFCIAEYHENFTSIP
jgi:hypothetical protein